MGYFVFLIIGSEETGKNTLSGFLLSKFLNNKRLIRCLDDEFKQIYNNTNKYYQFLSEKLSKKLDRSITLDKTHERYIFINNKGFEIKIMNIKNNFIKNLTTTKYDIPILILDLKNFNSDYM